MSGLIRFALMLAALAIGVALIAEHGIRAIILLVVVALAATVPRTRAWKAGERRLVRLTGSRRRAAGAILTFVIAAVVAVNIYGFMH